MKLEEVILRLILKKNIYWSDFITATMVSTWIVQLRVTRSLFSDNFLIPLYLLFCFENANLIDLVNLSSSSIFWIVSWWRIWSIKAFKNHLHQLCIQLLDFESASRIIIFHRQALLLHFTLEFFALFDDGQCKQQD
jgi:hypothetical protein